MRNALIHCLLAFALNACGLVYVSPQIDDTAPNVDVVRLTAQTLQTANQQAYTPRNIPAVFFQGTETMVSDASDITLPAGSVHDQDPLPVTARLPPPAADIPYRIGIGDVVLLSTRSNGGTVEEVTGLLAAQNSRQGYTVQDDGAIVVPDVGRVTLHGLTLQEAEAMLFQQLIGRQIDPTFSLEIAEFNSKRITIGGAVNHPVIVPITLTPLTLDEAMAQAGGFLPNTPNYTAIRIFRDGMLYQVPLADYLAEPDLQKIRLVAGDSLFVDRTFDPEAARAYFSEQISLLQLDQQAQSAALNAIVSEVTLRRAELTAARARFQERVALDAVERDYVYLTGEFQNPRRYTLPFGRRASLADALFDEGGFASETANPSQIYLLRPKLGQPNAVTAWHLNATVATNTLLATRLHLLPDDIIFIAEQPVTRWHRTVQQLVPSLLTTGVGAATGG